MSTYLSTFRPLVHNAFGRHAVAALGELPFVDASCRREPDLEATFPTVTALCRGGTFAPRLKVGDLILYLTVKGKYPPFGTAHRRMVALLQVSEEPFASHAAAARWFVSHGLPLPRNVVVPSNPPLDRARTDGAHLSVEEWDRGYKLRSRQFPVVLACRALFRELSSPPPVFDADLIAAFGRVPGTRNPPAVPWTAAKQLVSKLGICLDEQPGGTDG